MKNKLNENSFVKKGVNGNYITYDFSDIVDIDSAIGEILQDILEDIKKEEIK